VRTATPSAATLGFDVHGLRMVVRGDWPGVIADVGRDFAWFAEPSAPSESPGAGGGGDAEVVIQRRAPDYAPWRDLQQSFVTPRNVVYSRDSRSAIDYFGKALTVYDRRQGTARIQGVDPGLVHEAAYHFILSRIGQHLDAIGLPRLHALGLASRQGAVALFLPSGGGKSTLALRALQDEDIRLLSEDSPLIDRRGRLHPFPLRIGLNPHHAGEVPSEHVRVMERMEFHSKLVLDIDAYRDRVESSPQPLTHIVIGRRSLAHKPRLEPVPRRAAAGTLLREVVVGVGLYQGMEFVFRRGLADIGSQIRPALVRAARCGAGLRRASVWHLVLSRDRDRNWSELRRLIA
jgi:hypothetical protein